MFHAVFEATKGLAERLRQITGSVLDGADLVNACFTRVDPAIRINPHRTPSEVSEHIGFANLLRGVFGTSRNPTAHAARTEWAVSEGYVFDLFWMLSYLHGRDGATVSPRT